MTSDNTKKRDEKGQSTLELAFVLPVIIMIITAIIDFGLLFNNYLIISNAAREGARNAVIGTADAQIAVIMSSITGTLDQASMSITIEPAESIRKKGDEITVTVGYDNSLITPVISALVPNPVHIVAKTVMRME